MKKIGIIMVVLALVMGTVVADDRIISPEKLPQKAKDFIAQTFSGETIRYVEQDDWDYEVQLSNRTEIDFRNNGEWENIKCYAGIPFSAFPAEIGSYLKANFADEKVVEAERERGNYELKLTNYLEVYFDKNGKYLGQKYDD